MIERKRISGTMYWTEPCTLENFKTYIAAIEANGFVIHIRFRKDGGYTFTAGPHDVIGYLLPEEGYRIRPIARFLAESLLDGWLQDG